MSTITARPAWGDGMGRLPWAWAAIVVALVLLWLATLPFDGVGRNLFAQRPAWLQGTGTLTLGVMSVAMLLATRPVLLEPWLGGLDKMYRLHRWLGITALVVAITHWLWVEGPKWMVGWGWLVRPPRRPETPADGPLRQQLQAWRDPAEAVGEWAFYALVLLLALALLRRVPYRRFFQSHRLLPLVYLALVFHSVALMKASSWAQPLGLVMALLMATGSVAAVWVLVGGVGRSRQVLAVVDTLDLHAAQGVLEVAVQLKGRWGGHQAGQFAFVRFDAREGAHPFTIVSPWVDDGRMRFLIKGLGDHTRALPSQLKAGDLLRVEGPYGRFNFEGGAAPQIWVGGGIGITPFIARLATLALKPDGRSIDLFYATATADELAFARLRQAAQAAGVRLHVMLDAVDGRLSATRLCAAVPGWRDADVWFCGPAVFGRQLRRDLRALGLPVRRFHQELFELR